MQTTPIKYFHLQPDDALPTLAPSTPCKTIVLVESEVSQIWQWEVSRWLVASGCRYVLAWGKNCSEWEESVEEANLEQFNYEDIPQEQLVIATSHEDEELDEVFWFAKHRAHHPAHDLREVLVVHISDTPRREAMEKAYEDA